VPLTRLDGHLVRRLLDIEDRPGDLAVVFRVSLKDLHLDGVVKPVFDVAAAEEDAAVALLANAEFQLEEEVTVFGLCPKIAGSALCLQDAVLECPCSLRKDDIRQVGCDERFALGPALR